MRKQTKPQATKSALTRSTKRSISSTRKARPLLPPGLMGPLLISLGVLVGSAGADGSTARQASAYHDVHESGHEFISPLLDCMSPETRELDNFKPTIEALVEKAIDKGHATAVGVFFRDLMNGRWFGVGEDIDYNIASMGKVALLITYLRLAESEPALLERRFVVESTDMYEVQNIPPKRLLVLGNSYTVSELLEQLIVYSDNVAGAMLHQNMPGSAFEETVAMFGFRKSDHMNGFDVSARRFSALFRVLFNASYLSRGRSIYALELLSRTEFKDGLVAGVPPSLVVAHKFGERTDSGVSQMHDCGIVYYPERPYFLCVMTKGYEFKRLAAVIRVMSRAVYREVDRRPSGLAVNRIAQ